MKIKVSELSGAALDWAVASAEKMNPQTYFYKHGGHWVVPIARSGYNPGGKFVYWFTPSTDWSHGGSLIESNQVFLDPPHDMHRANYDEKTGKVKGCWETYESWHATVSARVRTLPPKIEGFPGLVGRGEGETALIAACRAIVASVFGGEIEIPQELAP